MLDRPPAVKTGTASVTPRTPQGRASFSCVLIHGLLLDHGDYRYFCRILYDDNVFYEYMCDSVSHC